MREHPSALPPSYGAGDSDFLGEHPITPREPRTGDVWEQTPPGASKPQAITILDVNFHGPIFRSHTGGVGQLGRGSWDVEVTAGRLRLLTPATEADGGAA